MTRRRTSLPLAPVIGAMFGVAATILVIAMPSWRFEQTVMATGLADAVAFAQPPLGVKARAIASLIAFILAGGVVTIIVWAAEQTVAAVQQAQRRRGDDTLELDAYRDADAGGSRRPIFADRELGAPFMSDEALQRSAEAGPLVLPDRIELVARERDDPAPVRQETATDPAASEVATDPTDDRAPTAMTAATPLDVLIGRLEAGMARRGRPPPRGPAIGDSDVTATARPAASGPDHDDRYDTTRAALSTLRRMAAR